MAYFSLALPRIAPFSIERKVSRRAILIWTLVIGGLFWQRVYLLSDAPLFDYDSVKNLQVIHKTASGNFTDIFHHSSPTFFLVYAVVYKVFSHYLYLEYLTAALNIAAIFLMLRLYGKDFHFERFEWPMMMLFVGTAFFQVASSRYLAIENLSLLLFAPIPWLYLQTVTNKEEVGTQYAWLLGILAALLLTVNYKALLLVPIFTLYDLLCGHLFRRKLSVWMGLLSPFIVLSLFYTFFGGMTGAGWDNYLKHWLILLIKQVNPHQQLSLLDGDVFYYFQYLADFESLLIWITFPAFMLHFLWKTTTFSPTARLLVLMVVGTWMLMSVLQKAPRGLLFIFPFLYFMSFAGLKYLVKNKKVFGGILAAAVLLNLLNCHLGIYQFTASSYSKMAEAVHALGIRKLAGTTGLGIQPYLSPKTQYEAVFDQNALLALQEEGFDYLLVDDYRIATGMADFFDIPHDQKPILAFQEPSLLAPMVWLELSEFTGMSYAETMALRKETLQKPWHIALMKLR